MSTVYTKPKLKIKTVGVSLVVFLKIHFLKGLEDMSLTFLHKNREVIQMPMVDVRKRLKLYVTSLIDAILSVISSYTYNQELIIRERESI